MEQKSKKIIGITLFVLSVVVVFIIGFIVSRILERRVESIARLQMVKPIGEWEPRNEVWGENFPREFESYLRTLDTTFRSKYAGSGHIDLLEECPESVIMWAGYAFAKDYNQGRGHAHAIEDVRLTLRTGGIKESPQPATCWSCKTTDFPRMVAKLGAEEVYKKKWFDLGHEMVNPIGCQDCHDPKTMRLRITRPALIEALERRGVKISEITHQEMRSLVCAQCHVEYYFKGPEKYLTFPWDKGFSADSMEAYYDEIGFSDWTHKLSKAKMLKAQHPDYELYMTGIHAKRGVACADCHMPYRVEGGVKYTDHHVRSPLANIANSCQVCHRQSEAELMRDVYERQDRVREVRKIAEQSIAKAHLEAEIAWKIGAKEDEMEPILKLIRSAQWRWDWVAAANGFGFHAPVEALRVLSTAIERAERARGLLSAMFTKYNVKLPVQLPDFSTKEKAQKYIGLDMKALQDDKNELIRTVIPNWDKIAKERQGLLYKY
ncbi:MAG: ammonia-forming cytochrome c nitrite reductase [Candidatus Kapaibacteriales bacterium]